MICQPTRCHSRAVRAAVATVAVALCGVPGAATAQPRASKTIVAVMALDDVARVLDPPVVEALTDALRGRLAQGGRFVVIDKSRQAAALERLVREQKKDSYRACYDARCQIPLGQALAAASILRTRLTRIGSSYHLNAELVDLAKEAVVSAAQAQVAVDPRHTREDRLLSAVVVIARQLGGGSSVTVPAHPRPGSGGLQQHAERTAAGGHAAAGARRQAALRASREAARQRALQDAEQQRRGPRSRADRGRRLRNLFYGWSSVAIGAAAAGWGVYYLTARANSEADRAHSAASPAEIDAAEEAARRAQTSGWVMIGAAAISAAVGTYLLLTAPDPVPDAPATTRFRSRLRLAGLPAAAATAGGLAVSWGGSF